MFEFKPVATLERYVLGSLGTWDVIETLIL